MEEYLLQSLFNGGKDDQIQAAIELSKLGSKQRHKLAEKGAIAPLVSMLHSQEYEAVEAALYSLLTLAFGSERNKVRIVNSGIVPVLLELLQCQNKVLVDLAIAALLVLSSCGANKMAITSSGAIPLLVEMLGEECGNDGNASSVSLQARLDAIATLHNLSTCRQIIPLIVSSGVVFSSLQLTRWYDKSSELVEKAMLLLENVVSSSETALMQLAGTSGAIRVLVETIEDGSIQCKEHAAGILLLICQSCRDKYRGLILREGVMPGLLQLSVDGTWRARDIAQKLLLLLRDCSSYEMKHKKLQHQLVEQIMQEIDAEGETVLGTSTLRLVEEMIAKLST